LPGNRWPQKKAIALNGSTLSAEQQRNVEGEKSLSLPPTRNDETRTLLDLALDGPKQVKLDRSTSP
jgi:hypothetical protein